MAAPAAATPQEPPKPAFNTAKLDALKADLIDIGKYAPQPRGYAFEDYLRRLFLEYGLRPREAFTNRGEQIDGSFLIGSDVCLLEAKWQGGRTGQNDLLVLEGRSSEPRRLGRVACSSATTASRRKGSDAFGRGRRSILMDGADMYEMLHRFIPFDHVIESKARRAAESGWPYVPVRDLF